MKNCEKDARVQVPTQAWVTAVAIMNIDETLQNTPNISLREYIDIQKEKTNVWTNNPDISIYNDGFLFMMAYAFLVVPKESIARLNLNISCSSIDIILQKMTIRKNKKQHDLGESENIIRHIRNSISHADFNIDDERNITFIDQHQGEVTFNGEMGINEFKSLIAEYFNIFYKCYHQKYIAGKA